MSDPPDPRTGRAPPRARRVGRACDYCRRKRLKCTPNQRPCFNCQLYDVDCTSKDLRRRPYPQLTRDEPPSEQPAIYNDQNSASLIEEPSVVPAVDSRIPLTGDCDDNSRNDHQLTPSSWSQGPDLSTGIGNSTQDFDTVLRDLGIGFSSDFWDMDRTMATSLSETCGDFAQPTVAVDSVGTDAGVAKDGLTQLRVNADAFSPSSKLPARRAGGRVSNIESLIGADVHPANVQTSVPPGLFVRKNEVVANYIGFNSVGATLALCLKDALDSQNLPLKATSLGFLIEAGPHVDEVGLTSMVDTSLIDLPPHEVAMHAIEAFMRNLNVFYPIVEEESYRTRSQMFYTAERPQLHTMDYALFFLVLSIGALSETHSGGRSEDMEQLSTGAYHQAWTLMQDSIASPTETSLQILLLYVIHHLYHGKCGIAWVFCGLAIRIAQSLGLHRKIPQEMELSLNHERLRSRLWWIVFCFDANLSLSQGRPPGVTDATYETAPVPPEPTDLSSDDGDENGQPLSPRLPQIYTWMRRLGQIQNEFCNTMHLNTTAGARLDVIVRINHQLTKWRDTIPSGCRPGELILVSPEIYHNIVLLHLDYLNLSRAVHWTIITLQAATQRRPQVLDQRLRVSEASCVDAARSFIRTLNESSGDLQGRKVFVNSLHTINYMAAIATLYRSICKAPSGFSARADLEHLRAGKVHLDRDTSDDVTRPELRTLFNNMLSSAEKLVWSHTIPISSG